MSEKDDVAPIIQRLKELTFSGSDTELAFKIGLKRDSVANWRRRSVDYKAILNYALENNLDVQYIFTGELSPRFPRPRTRASFNSRLSSLLNSYSIDNDCDTPDYILAEYLIKCLAVFKEAIKSKQRHSGVEDLNVGLSGLEANKIILNNK